MRARCSAKIVLFLAGVFAVLSFPVARAQFSGPASDSLSAKTIPQKDLIQPAELVHMLKTDSALQNPLLLQVGSHVMYVQAHIPHSEYAGPGSQASGLGLLKQALASTPKSRLVVIYCGCCPWERCPNMGPAYRELHELGFENVKALYLANNFGDDWVAKGYPVERGE